MLSEIIVNIGIKLLSWVDWYFVVIVSCLLLVFLYFNCVKWNIIFIGFLFGVSCVVNLIEM